MTHLSITLREEIFDCVLQEIIQVYGCMQNEIQIESETESTLESSDSSTPESSTGKRTRKRKRKSPLMEPNFIKKVQNNDIAFKDILQSELLGYKTEPSILVDQPLHW